MGLESERQLRRFDEFVAALEADARVHALEVWNDFATRLRKRWVQEEQLVLPHYAKTRPVEAQALRHEHDQLRHDLRGLSTRLELHLLRAEHARQFLRRLRRHVHAKDALYCWAEIHLTPSQRAQLQHQLQDPAASSASTPAFESGSFEAYK
jgi:hypothetical protein